MGVEINQPALGIYPVMDSFSPVRAAPVPLLLPNWCCVCTLTVQPSLADVPRCLQESLPRLLIPHHCRQTWSHCAEFLLLAAGLWGMFHPQEIQPVSSSFIASSNPDICTSKQCRNFFFLMGLIFWAIKVHILQVLLLVLKAADC